MEVNDLKTPFLSEERPTESKSEITNNKKTFSRGQLFSP
jgi:hypothetical protein